MLQNLPGPLAFMVLLVNLAGCSAGPPATRYLLPTVRDTAPIPIPEQRGTPPAVRLADVRLPSYLADASIAYMRADGSVVALPGEQWAEDPQQAITRAVGDALHQASRAMVIYEPWPVGLESAGSVSVSIHRLLGVPGGETRLTGQFLLVSAGQVLTVHDFDLREAVNGSDTQALLRSYAKALERLAQLVAAKLEQV